MFKLKIMKKNNFFVISAIAILLLYGVFINKSYKNTMNDTYHNAYFKTAVINKFIQETRRSYYIYVFKVNGIEYNRKTVSEENYIKEGDKVLIMFNKEKPSESFLLRNTTIPEEYLNKDTIWTSPPDFINPEDLKFLED